MEMMKRAQIYSLREQSYQSKGARTKDLRKKSLTGDGKQVAGHGAMPLGMLRIIQKAHKVGWSEQRGRGKR